MTWQKNNTMVPDTENFWRTGEKLCGLLSGFFFVSLTFTILSSCQLVVISKMIYFWRCPAVLLLWQHMACSGCNFDFHHLVWIQERSTPNDVNLFSARAQWGWSDTSCRSHCRPPRYVFLLFSSFCHLRLYLNNFFSLTVSHSLYIPYFTAISAALHPVVSCYVVICWGRK